MIIESQPLGFDFYVYNTIEALINQTNLIQASYSVVSTCNSIRDQQHDDVGNDVSPTKTSKLGGNFMLSVRSTLEGVTGW